MTTPAPPVQPRVITMRPILAAFALLWAGYPGLARAVEAERPPAPLAAAPVTPVTVVPPAPDAAPARPQGGMSEAQTYCQNIASAAADARFARESKALSLLETEIKQRVADLEAKQAAYQEVLARHDEAVKRAELNLVAIYAQMRPDAAATQLSALDDATAAAVLSQLKPRQASQILSEVTPERAVRLVNAIAGLAPLDDKKS